MQYIKTFYDFDVIPWFYHNEDLYEIVQVGDYDFSDPVLWSVPHFEVYLIA